MLSNNAATITSWRKSLVRGALALLSLAGFELPKGWTQMQFNGGYVQTHRDDRGDSKGAAAPNSPRSAPVPQPPSVFPDNDFYYPTPQPSFFFPGNDIYYPAPQPPSTAIIRSYYTDGEPGRPLAPLVGNLPLPAPRRYSLEIIRLSKRAADSPAPAMLIAHVPEHVRFWVEGVPTRSTGPTRYFESPPLPQGRRYSYTVRAAWIEDGQWVSQSQTVPVQAGTVQAIYLRPR